MVSSMIHVSVNVTKAGLAIYAHQVRTNYGICTAKTGVFKTMYGVYIGQFTQYEHHGRIKLTTLVLFE